MSWFKCYPSDFLNGVSELSPNELAVYTIVLMRMYDEDGPIKDEPERIARRCNMRKTACKKAIEGLIEEGKLTRENGLLFNERVAKVIEKRHELSTKQARNAKARWSKRSKKPNKINGRRKPLHSRGSAKDMPLDTRYQILDKPPNPLLKKVEAFFDEQFYPKYPRKDAPAAGRKAFVAACKKASPDEIMAGLRAYEFSDDPKFIPLPATWLNQERWKAEGKKEAKRPSEWTLDDWRHVLGPPGGPVAERAKNWWPGEGNFPDGAPKQILKEYGWEDAA